MDLLRLLQIVIDMGILVFAVSVHESAHGLMASLLGDPTARDLKRITLNPIRHIDFVGSILFPFVLAVTGAPVFGWAKPVPVDVNRLRNPRRDMAYVSAAGPISNSILAIASFVLLFGIKMIRPDVPELVMRVVLRQPVQGAGPLLPVVYILVSVLIVNLVLALFNLIPVPPLDGSGILAAFLPPSSARAFRSLSRYGMLIVFALLWLGVFDKVLRPILIVVLSLIVS